MQIVKTSVEASAQSPNRFLRGWIVIDMQGTGRGAMFNSRLPVVLLIICAVLLSGFTVYIQARAMGLAYIEQGNQLKRHLAMIHGVAGSPWQYRVLTTYLVEIFSFITHTLKFPHPLATAFISFRIIQNILIFLVAAAYYRRLGLNLYAIIVGLSMLAWGMTYSLYDCDFEFNTYADILFYLTAGLTILMAKYIWILPISVLAAFNRETGLLIPFMLIAVCRTQDAEMRWRNLVTGFLSIAVFVLILLGLRYAYAPQEMLDCYGHKPGLDTIKWNFFRVISWVQMFGTMGILPFLAIFSIGMWPAVLRRFFWAIVPLWFGVHFGWAVPWAESRYFLVPQSLIFIPGVMIAVVQSGMVRIGGQQGEVVSRKQA